MSSKISDLGSYRQMHPNEEFPIGKKANKRTVSKEALNDMKLRHESRMRDKNFPCNLEKFKTKRLKDPSCDIQKPESIFWRNKDRIRLCPLLKPRAPRDVSWVDAASEPEVNDVAIMDSQHIHGLAITDDEITLNKVNKSKVSSEDEDCFASRSESDASKSESETSKNIPSKTVDVPQYSFKSRFRI